MKKLVLLLALFSTPFVWAHKRDTEEQYKKAELLAYEVAEKNKDAKHDDFHRHYLDVVMENYKQSWFDHHPVLTAGLVVVSIIAVLAIIVAASPDRPRNRGGGGGGDARPDGGPRPHAGARDRLREALVAEERQAAMRAVAEAERHAGMRDVGRNPLLNDPAYAHLRPRPEGAPAVRGHMAGAGAEGAPNLPPAYGDAVAADAPAPAS